MSWIHEWGAPSVVVVRTPRGNLHTARQQCVRCGTSRNPFTRAIVARTRGQCAAAAEVRQRDYSVALERVAWDLDALASDGHLVDHEHPRRIEASSQIALL